MRRLVKNLIYLGVITAVEIGVFAHYNHLLTVAKNTTVAATPAVAPVEEKPTSVSGIQPLKSNLVAVSDDGQRVAYVNSSNKLIAVDVATGKTLYSLQLMMKPVYLGWIRNDSLFIGTEVPDGNLKDLRLSTLTLSSGQLRLIHVFSGYAPEATFQNVTFSPYTNDVYVLISSKVASVMYHYDTNGNLTYVDLGGRYVTYADTTSTSNIVYFQDFAQGTPNLLMRDNQGSITVLQRNAALLRVVGNTAYYGLLDSQGNVTQIDSYVAPTDLGSASSSANAPIGGNNTGTGNSSGTSGSTSGSTSSGTSSSTGGTGNASGSNGSGVQAQVMTLPQPTPPSQVYISDNHDVYVVTTSQIEDLTTKQQIQIPANGQAVRRSNSLILLSPDGKLQFII